MHFVSGPDIARLTEAVGRAAVLTQVLSHSNTQAKNSILCHPRHRLKRQSEVDSLYSYGNLYLFNQPIAAIQWSFSFLARSQKRCVVIVTHHHVETEGRRVAKQPKQETWKKATRSMQVCKRQAFYYIVQDRNLSCVLYSMQFRLLCGTRLFDVNRHC